jgi:hypothetical protein
MTTEPAPDILSRLIQLQELVDRVNGTDRKLTEVRDLLLSQRTVKDWYSTAEVAEAVHKDEFTVREWCRHGRVRADKKSSGRGKHKAWAISHVELLRYQREGLLPDRRSQLPVP